MKTRSILALIALLGSTVANAGIGCDNFNNLRIHDTSPYSPPYYVGDDFGMKVTLPAYFTVQNTSGTLVIGNVAANALVEVGLIQTGLHIMRANYQGSDCTLDEWVYALPSLGTVSVSGTLWTFTNLTFSVISSGGAPPATYDWDFNDGNTANNVGTNVVHQFAAAGTYVVSVDMTAGGGRTDTATKTVVVVNNPNLPGLPGPVYEDHLGCGGASAQHKISWSAPASGATASTYRLTITGGGTSSTFWNSTTNKTRWLTPNRVHTVKVRGCVSQSESTCGPTRTGQFTSNACSGGVD